MIVVKSSLQTTKRTISRIFWQIMAIALFLCMLQVKAQNKTGNRVEFTKDIAKDATPQVLEKIMALSKEVSNEIYFQKGTYHFYPDKAKELFVHISNHNDVLTRTAFPIQGFENLIVDGQGAHFIFHGKIIPFLIENSTNITVRNITIDWAQSFHSEGVVLASDEVNKTFDVSFSKAYPYEIRNEKLVFVKEYYEHTVGQSILFDPKRSAPMYNTEAYTQLTSYEKVTQQYAMETISYKYENDRKAPRQHVLGKQNTLRAKELEPGVVRFYGHKKKMPPKGMVLICKGVSSVNRLAPAFRLSFVSNFKAYNINVHHAGGMGLIAENSSDLVLDGFNVTPSKDRLVSATADATHFVGCRGKVVLKNCTFTNQLDDASNIHGSYQKVVDILDDYTIGVRMGHFQQQNFSLGIENDTIGIIRLTKSFYPYQKLTLKQIEKINGRYHKISFHEKLPQGLVKGDLLENLSAYPELLVENCTIANNRARGLLLSTPKPVVVRNNFFSTEMEALLFPVESGHWYESGNVNNVLIENNTFKNCNHGGHNRGIIRFKTDDDNENIAFKNVTILGNTIDHFDNLIMEVSNTNELRFEENLIRTSKTFPKLYPNEPVIKITNSKNIDFKRNNYLGNAKEMVRMANSERVSKFK